MVDVKLAKNLESLIGLILRPEGPEPAGTKTSGSGCVESATSDRDRSAGVQCAIGTQTSYRFLIDEDGVLRRYSESGRSGGSKE